MLLVPRGVRIATALPAAGDPLVPAEPHLHWRMIAARAVLAGEAKPLIFEDHILLAARGCLMLLPTVSYPPAMGRRW